MVMARVATLEELLWPLVGLCFLFLQLHGAQARWLGSHGAHVQAELPPCSSVPAGIPGWDCYDPPTHPLPPCDFKHQRIGFDCSGWPPARHNYNNNRVGVDSGTFKSQSAGHVEAELPRCSSVPGGIPGWDCYDPPTHPLPPCDFKHQKIGFDCSGWPPASHKYNSNRVIGAHAGTFKSQSSGHVEAELPPCSSVPGGTPGWDCYDPPTHPLPPCDFQHQRIGFDCSGWPPASN